MTALDPAVRAQAGAARAPRGSGEAVHRPRSARAGWAGMLGSSGGEAEGWVVEEVEVAETGASSSAQAMSVSACVGVEGMREK